VRVFYVDNVGNVNGPGKVARSESAHRNNLASTVLKRRINECQKIEVHTSSNPALALSEFKPNFYDLLLVDINMPNMNGFELCEKMLAIDINVKVCFMSSVEVNREALREIYPAISLGCFIRKPVTIDYLITRIMSELD
jgi:two-component SAPR family response regulator